MPPSQARANHSIVASMQHMSAMNGGWVIGAIRCAIECNPITGSQLHHNGGSSIWSPRGLNPAAIRQRAEPGGGAFERLLSQRASRGPVGCP